MVETYFIDPAVDLVHAAYCVGRDAARWGWPLEAFERALLRWDAEMEWAGVPAAQRQKVLKTARNAYNATIEAAA